MFIRSFYLSLDFDSEVISLSQNRNLREHSSISDAKVSLVDYIEEEDDDLIEKIDEFAYEIEKDSNILVDILKFLSSIW